MEQPKGFKYTFIVQCKELINENASRIIATVRIEDKYNGDFLRVLENLKCNPEIIKQIYIGDVEMDFSTAPVIEPSKEVVDE